VRHNVVLPEDAAPWRRSSTASCHHSGRRAANHRDSGREFFATAAEALQQSGSDLKVLTKLLKERTGRKGAELFMPLRIA